jgi:hypothetical protein
VPRPGPFIARWPYWLPPIAAGTFYAVFIARAGFDYRGRTYFTLFDDAMISMRYARNLADGNGLVWNPGQYVEGYSNFLWTLWMAAIHVLPIPENTTSLAVMVSEALLLVLGVVVVGRIARLVAPDSRLVAPVAMLLTGLYYPLAFWALRGMEVGLASLLISLAVLLALELCNEWSSRRCWGLAAVLAAAVLTRDDLVVPAAIVLAFLAWQLDASRRTRTLAIVGGAVAVAVAGHELFRVVYYGDALPNTYYLKLSGISLGTRLHRGIESLASAATYDLYAPLILAGAGVVLRWRSGFRPAMALLGTLFLAQCAYSVYVGGDAWEQVKFANRYVASVAPLLMVLAAVGVAALAAPTRRAVVACAAAAFGVAAVLLAHPVVPTHRLGFEPEGGVQLVRALPAFMLGVVLLASAARHAGARIASHSGLIAAAIVVLALVAVDAKPVGDWARSNAHFLDIDRGLTESGVTIKEHTAPQAEIAMTAAGSVAYFDHRPGIDLLGKMDPVVAHEPTRSLLFRPGHSKWDYGHSIGRLRPEVVTQLWNPVPADYCNMGAWGYRQVAPRLYVRDPQARVDAPGLAAGLRAIGRQSPYPPPTKCPPRAP